VWDAPAGLQNFVRQRERTFLKNIDALCYSRPKQTRPPSASGGGEPIFLSRHLVGIFVGIKWINISLKY
jgi:hypothetical protein